VTAYDYVIIGAGTAGCVLANRLSADPKVSVCVLEAGPSDRFALIHNPGALGALFFMKRYDWSFKGKPDPAIRKGEPLFCARGKTLGGSSSINGMVYSRGHPADYDHWVELGNPGWSFEEVLPYFRKLESNVRGASKYHGADGPMKVSDCEFQFPIAKVFVDAAKQIGMPITDDLSAPPYEGIGPYQHTIDNGRRCSTADGYLHPVMSRPNLTVTTEAQVVSIDFNGKRAAGVSYEHGGHRTSIKAKREVILSAGAYQSPQLLMLSGVGDPDELKAHGIKLVHTLPGVGKNLMDHPAIFLQSEGHHHAGVQVSLLGLLEQMGQGIEYYAANAGKMRASAVESGGFLKTDPALPRPDIQMMFEPMLFDFAAQSIATMRKHGFSCHIAALSPKSRGTVGLASADPLAPPVIDYRLLSHPDDVKTLVAGVRLIRKIFAAPAFDKYRKEEFYPGADVQSDEALGQAIRDRAAFAEHASGTCKMGTDDMAVVDAQLRVRGLEGLRVVDASIMPTLANGNIYCTVIMIGEKAADMILGAQP
jgi:choline dehydrogenase